MTAQPTETAEDREEAVDAELRQRLGLRATACTDHGPKGTHPDQRPCPSWCWVGQEDGYEHEVEPNNPMIARHDYEPRMPVVATLYPGTSNDGTVKAATIEFNLSARGQCAPTIDVYLRSSRWVQGQGWEHTFEKSLRLTLTDADEVSRALAHLVEVAEKQ